MEHESKMWEWGNFLISTDKTLLQVKRIHNFLSREAYWCLNIPLDVVEKSIEHSLCFGIYTHSVETITQIGYGRVVSDYATFAWICDIYVEAWFRGKGLANWLMECIMSHPSLKGLRRICLATKDAQVLYKNYGFEVTKTPSNWMEIKNNDIYKKLTKEHECS